LESIAWQTPKGRLQKIKLYDAGARHGTHGPGHRLRLECERRWDGAKTPTPEQVTTANLAALFVGPIKPWLARAKTVSVTTPVTAMRDLFGEALRGERKRRSAEGLCGNIGALLFGSGTLKRTTEGGECARWVARGSRSITPGSASASPSICVRR
jgi:hypothetical protein